MKRALPTSSMRSMAMPVRMIASSTLPISEGWRLKGPMSIQRLEPLTAVPTTNTTASDPSRPPHRPQAQRASLSRLRRVATIISTVPTVMKRICRLT